MINAESLKDNINKLSEFDLQELFNYIGERMTLKSLSHGLDNEFKESRFANQTKIKDCILASRKYQGCIATQSAELYDLSY